MHQFLSTLICIRLASATLLYVFGALSSIAQTAENELLIAATNAWESSIQAESPELRLLHLRSAEQAIDALLTEHTDTSIASEVYLNEAGLDFTLVELDEAILVAQSETRSNRQNLEVLSVLTRGTELANEAIAIEPIDLFSALRQHLIFLEVSNLDRYVAEFLPLATNASRLGTLEALNLDTHLISSRNNVITYCQGRGPSDCIFHLAQNAAMEVSDNSEHGYDSSRVFHDLGINLSLAGDFTEAERVAKMIDDGETELRAGAWSSIAMSYGVHGQAYDAQRLFDLAEQEARSPMSGFLRWRTDEGEYSSVANALVVVGENLAIAGRVEEARLMFSEAEQLASDHLDGSRRGNLLENLVESLIFLGDFSEAERIASAARDLRGFDLGQIATALAEKGEIEGAERVVSYFGSSGNLALSGRILALLKLADMVDETLQDPRAARLIAEADELLSGLETSALGDLGGMILISVHAAKQDATLYRIAIHSGSPREPRNMQQALWSEINSVMEIERDYKRNPDMTSLGISRAEHYHFADALFIASQLENEPFHQAPVFGAIARQIAAIAD